MDSWDRFKEMSLPSIKRFYSNLNMSEVSNADYEHTCSVLRAFGIRNMGEYHDLYLRINVILLSNVLKSFRRVCPENYGLDPSHFYTAPGLAWKAFLKKTGIRLELLLDPNMLLMIERGVRGGITQSVHRWATANNPYIGSEYDPCRPTKYHYQWGDYTGLNSMVLGQKLPRHKPPDKNPLDKNPLAKTPQTKTPQIKHSFQKFYNFCF